MTQEVNSTEGDKSTEVESATNDKNKSKEGTAETPTTNANSNVETATDVTADSEGATGNKSNIIVSSTKKSRPPYKYDPNKITLRFLFANRDGLTVTIECKPTDTVGEVKGALISVWPEDMPDCDTSEDLRLICMGKGYLSPDTRTLEDCQIPVFKTHPTPINVSVKPGATSKKDHHHDSKTKKGNDGHHNTRSGNSSNSINQSSSNATGGTPANRSTTESGQGCGCIIQ